MKRSSWHVWATLVMALSGCLVAAAAEPSPAQKQGSPASAASPASPASAASVPLVSVLESAGGDSAVSLAEARHPLVDLALTLLSQSDREQQLEITVLPFVRDSGESVAPELLIDGRPGSTLTLPARGARRVHLRARLVADGGYRSLVVISSASKHEPTSPLRLPIDVKRLVGEPPIEVVAPAAIPQLVSWPWRTDPPQATLQVFARGSTQELGSPSLLKSTRKAKIDSAEGAEAGLSLAPAGQGPRLEVRPGQALAVALTLNGIQGPGRYDATIRFDLAGYNPVDRVVTLLVRWHWWVAFALILLGVLASLAVKVFTTVTRPRLLVQARVASLRSQLDAATEQAGTDAQAQELLAQVEQALQARWTKARVWRRVVGSEFDVYESIVPALLTWIELHRRQATVRPAAAGVELRKSLQDARAAFVAAQPDATQVETAIKALDAAPQTMRAALDRVLREAVEAMDKQLKADKRQEFVALRESVRRVRDQLQQGQLDAAAVQWALVLRRHVEVFADDLRRRVAESSAMPMGFDDATWAARCEAARDAIGLALAEADAEAAGHSLRAAIREHQSELAAAMQRAVASLPDDKRQRFKAALDELIKALDSDDAAPIWRALDAVQAAQAGRPMGGGVAAEPEAEFVAGTTLDLPASWAAIGRPGAAAATRASLTALDFVVSAIVVVVAGLVGVQQLWADHLTWGGGVAMLAAFLTGFAADQLTHAGVKALIKP